jgi:hypothetical protein
MTFMLTAPGSPQAQRFAFVILSSARDYIREQLVSCHRYGGPMNDQDVELFKTLDVLDSCIVLVKWGKIEHETFDTSDWGIRGENQGRRIYKGKP